MNVLVIPAVKVATKLATAAGLSRIVSGVVMTNTPIETKTQLFLVRVAAIGITSLATKVVGAHTDEQIDTIVEAVKNRDEHIKVVMNKKEEVESSVKETIRDAVQDEPDSSNA